MDRHDELLTVPRAYCRQLLGLDCVLLSLSRPLLPDGGARRRDPRITSFMWSCSVAARLTTRRRYSDSRERCVLAPTDGWSFE